MSSFFLLLAPRDAIPIVDSRAQERPQCQDNAQPSNGPIQEVPLAAAHLLLKSQAGAVKLQICLFPDDLACPVVILWGAQ